MKTPDELIDAVARDRGYVSPVPVHFPLSRADVLAVIAARDAEWINEQRPRERQIEGSK